MSPELAASLGISICYQHPTILDDLSVLENLRVGLPADFFAGRQLKDQANKILREVGLRLPLNTRGESLTFAQKQLLEIAKALAVKPKLLILDEPTASLDQESTDMLFTRVRAALRDGTSVIYITHRIAELREIAHRVTVLRDGRVRGGAFVAEVSNQDLLDMIVGRALGSAFPPKHGGPTQDVLLSVNSLSCAKYSDVSLEVARGQIVGVAGVAGNGQAELMRGLAGLEAARGEVRLGTQVLTQGQLQNLAAFMPSDRHVEGLAGSLSIRENAALGALDQFGAFGLVNRKREMQMVDEAFTALAVKAPSMEAPVLALSGGNQQKVVMARALLSKPRVIIADEPTQGVDVGARAEIYRILREHSNAGMAVIVNSSDAAELEGLCDKVLVMSRGRVVQTLTGEDVVEARIVAAAVEAETHVHGAAPARGAASKSGWRHFLQSDNAPVVPLTLTVILLALLGYEQNTHYLSSFNISNILQLATTLGLIAMGQTIPLLLGGIDLSVGPMAGFLV
ncbi:MAG TPA: ATP-binding cassette domain-containing protein, partial [Acidocella sp.]|nr:ATP-binding cassette domain-containing protein [Acidocella sp.]